jgi:hypothetical protein
MNSILGFPWDTFTRRWLIITNHHAELEAQIERELKAVRDLRVEAGDSPNRRVRGRPLVEATILTQRLRFQLQSLCVPVD